MSASAYLQKSHVAPYLAPHQTADGFFVNLAASELLGVVAAKLVGHERI